MNHYHLAITFNIPGPGCSRAVQRTEAPVLGPFQPPQDPSAFPGNPQAENPPGNVLEYGIIEVGGFAKLKTLCFSLFIKLLYILITVLTHLSPPLQSNLNFQLLIRQSTVARSSVIEELKPYLKNADVRAKIKLFK